MIGHSKTWRSANPRNAFCRGWVLLSTEICFLIRLTSIKPAALAQEHMKEEDQRAYREYVQSGAQALDFAMVSAQASAADARKNGDMARSDMWERRFEDLRRERERMGR